MENNKTVRTFTAIMTYTLKNNGGTFKSNGVPVHFSKGYQVALTDNRYPLKRQGAISRALYDVMYWAAGIPSVAYIGTWVDEGCIYIDESIWVPDLATALEYGRKFGQKTVLQWSSMECIDVKGGTQNGQKVS